MAFFTTVFLLMRSSTAMNSRGLRTLPCLSPILTSNSSEAPSPTTTLAVVLSYVPSTIYTSASGIPIHRSVAITISLVTLSKAFSRSTNPRAILPCTSSLFSTICLRTYIPSAVPLPFMNPCCSSPKSHSILLLILASKTLSKCFSTWLSSVMPLYFPGSCTSPFLFHIGTIRPILHSFGILPSCIHTFRSLPVHLTPTSPAISNISSRTSSAPVALTFFILCIAVSTSSCRISSTSTSLLTELGSSRQLAALFPFSSSLKFAAHILNTSLLSVMSLPLLSLITAPLFTSLPSSVLSRMKGIECANLLYVNWGCYHGLTRTYNNDCISHLVLKEPEV